MNVFIRAMVRIFSFGERWNVLFNSAIASLNRTFHLSPNENILTIARIKTFTICIILSVSKYPFVNKCIYILISWKTAKHCKTFSRCNTKTLQCHLWNLRCSYTGAPEATWTGGGSHLKRALTSELPECRSQNNCRTTKI